MIRAFIDKEPIFAAFPLTICDPSARCLSAVRGDGNFGVFTARFLDQVMEFWPIELLSNQLSLPNKLTISPLIRLKST